MEWIVDECLLPFCLLNFAPDSWGMLSFRQALWCFLTPQHQSMALYLMDFVFAQAHHHDFRHQSHYRPQSHSAVNVDIWPGWASLRCVWQDSIDFRHRIPMMIFLCKRPESIFVIFMRISIWIRKRREILL